MATNNPPSPNSNKRKRDGSESTPGRAMAHPATNGQDEMFRSLLQNLDGDNAPAVSPDESSRTAQAALQQQQSSYPEPSVFDNFPQHSVSHQQHLDQPLQHPMQNSGQGLFDSRQSQSQKPSVGSTAWHQQRKDSHKEGIYLSSHSLHVLIINSGAQTKRGHQRRHREHR